MPVPYIGITDFTSFTQVEWMLDVFDLWRQPNQNRRLHVGVMMSYKTLNDLPTEWAKAMPAKETIADIFRSNRTMNCLHYADRKGIDVEASLITAIGYGGEGINALQLDMTWPDPFQVERALAASSKDLEVVLQIGSTAFEIIGNDPEELVAQIRTYLRCVHHVLLDKSGGKGLGMDTQGLRPFIRAIRKELPSIGITVAGGLGPNTLDLVEPLVEEFPSLSIDAQGKLRPSGDSLNEPIDWNMAGAYLASALRLFGRTEAA